MDLTFGLIATDLSEYCLGISACVELYARLGLKKVHLLHVLEEGRERPLPEAEEALEGLACTFREAGMLTAMEIKRGRDPASEILKCSRQLRPDLLILGSHGAGFWKRFLIGSVSHKVLAHGSGPMLIERLPEGEIGQQDLGRICQQRHRRVILASGKPRPHGPGMEVLLRLAGSDGLQHAFLFTSLEMSEMVRVHVLDKLPEMEEAALEALQRAASPLRELAVPVAFHVEAKNTSHSLKEKARRWDAGLVLLEIQGPDDPWNALVVGLVSQLPCSALVLR